MERSRRLFYARRGEEEALYPLSHPERVEENKDERTAEKKRNIVR